MTDTQIKILLEKQRAYYKTGVTVPVEFRIAQLKKLYAAVKKYELQVGEALKADLGKSHFEGFMCERGMVLSEISYMIRHVRKFAKRQTVWTPLAQFASHSFRQPVPYGNTLIMSPWNYPFLLAMDPLADAIAAGNTAIVKPSAYSPATSKIIEKSLKNARKLISALQKHAPDAVIGVVTAQQVAVRMVLPRTINVSNRNISSGEIS